MTEYQSTIRLKGDIKDIQRKLDQVNNKLDSMGDIAEETGRRTESSFNKTGLAVTAFIATLGLSIKKAIDTSAEFEFMETRLTSLYGSVEAGKKAFETFNKVAAQTPFQLNAVVEAGAQLKAFGLNAEETIGVASDLAAFMGLDIVDAANAMGRAFAGGAGAADILRERGILNLIKEFKGIDDLTKLTLPEFREAMLDTFFDTTSGISGSSKRLSRTWVGMISNMMDSISRFSDAVGDFLIPAFKPLITIIRDGATTAENFFRIIVETDLETTIRRLKELGAEIEVINKLEASNVLLKNIEREAVLRERLNKTTEYWTKLQGKGIKANRELANNMLMLTDSSISLDDKMKILSEQTTSYTNLMVELGKEQAKGDDANQDYILGLETLIGQFDNSLPKYKAIIEYLVELEKITKANADAQDILNKKNEESKPDKNKGTKLTKDEELKKFMIVEAFETRRLELKNQTMEAELRSIDAYYAQQKEALINAGIEEEAITEQVEAAKADIKKKYIYQSLSVVAQGFANLATLAKSQGRKGIQVAKRAAQVETIISTIASAQKAYESGLRIPLPAPAPMMIATALAALAYGAGYARVKEIEAQKFAEGAIFTKPVFSPVLKGGAIAGEAGPEAVIPLKGDNVITRLEKRLNNESRVIHNEYNIMGNVMTEEYYRDHLKPIQERQERLDLA